MRKLVGLFIVLTVALYASSLIAAEKTVEKVVIEKSPFSKARFLLRSRDSASSSYDPTEQGKIDAQYANVPRGELEVYFYDAIQDDALLGQNDTHILWSNVLVMVEPGIKGMALSYKRHVNKITLEDVVLHVPTTQDKEMWQSAADDFVRRYRDTFWKKRIRLMTKEQEISLEEAKKHLELERLRQGPILVYPNQ